MLAHHPGDVSHSTHHTGGIELVAIGVVEHDLTIRAILEAMAGDSADYFAPEQRARIATDEQLVETGLWPVEESAK